MLALTRLATAQTEAAPLQAPAGPTEPTFQDSLNQAYELLQRGEPARAVVLLEQLQRQRSDASLFYALGMAYAANNQPTLAAGSLERFFGGADAASAPPDVQVAAQRQLTDYQRQLSRLSVTFVLLPRAVPATLYLNGQLAAELRDGAVPPTLWLLPGTYQVLLSAPGARTYQTKLELQPGELRQLVGSLEEDQRPLPLIPGTVGPPWNAKKATSTIRKVLIGTGIAVGTLLVAGIVTAAVVVATSDGSSSSHHHHHFDFD
ncbi:MAG: hypothetical protein QM813_18830 [Verrucomicrobiota bacterium]